MSDGYDVHECQRCKAEMTAPEGSEITKSIIFVNTNQDESLLVYFVPDLVPNLALSFYIKYAVLINAIYFKLQINRHHHHQHLNRAEWLISIFSSTGSQISGHQQ
jgi:hypothetical protein